MKRYMIEMIKSGTTEGGMACGPVGGTEISAVKFNDGERSMWLYLAVVGGISDFSLTDKDIFDELIEEDFDDDYIKFINDISINEFNGIRLEDDLLATMYSIYENQDNPAAPIIKLLIAAARNWAKDNMEAVEKCIGKYADEADIPVSDVEEDYLRENAQDDE